MRYLIITGTPPGYKPLTHEEEDRYTFLMNHYKNLMDKTQKDTPLYHLRRNIYNSHKQIVDTKIVARERQQ